MDTDDVEPVSQLHKSNRSMTSAAIHYEYFGNPQDGSKLMFGSVDGEVVASQAFVAQQLILDGRLVPTLMSERTLLAPSWRGRAAFTSFYLASLDNAFSGSTSMFVWGGTAAVKPFAKYGFNVIDCLAVSTLALSARPALDALRSPRTIAARLGWTAIHARSWIKYRLGIRKLGNGSIKCGLPPNADSLQALFGQLCDAHPATYFFYLSPAKRAWLVDQNPFRRRQMLSLRQDDLLVGVVVFEVNPDSQSADLVELLLPDLSLLDAAAAAIAGWAAGNGVSLLSWFGNEQCPYVNAIHRALIRAGAHRRRSQAQLVVRGPPSSADAPPDPRSLAMTGIWGPPA